jgi:hypothetical protein
MVACHVKLGVACVGLMLRGAHWQGGSFGEVCRRRMEEPAPVKQGAQAGELGAVFGRMCGKWIRGGRRGWEG